MAPKKKPLRVLLLFDSPYATDEAYDFSSEFATDDWQSEADVYRALCSLGYDVRVLGLFNSVEVLVRGLKNFKPDIVVNLAEVFDQQSCFEKNIVAILEMMKIPYTGSSSTSLMICNDKALTKKILSFHKIKVPHFHTYYRNRPVRLSRRLRLPLIIKPLCEEASRGISLASVVDSEELFIERMRYIHTTLKNDAIAEEYIPGREFYVGVLGHKRLSVLPPIELRFANVPDDEPRVATYKAKWDTRYRKKWGIKNVFPGRLPNGLEEQIADMCKRAYRALNMRSYARFDIRVTESGRTFIIEANANPCIAKKEDFALCAQKFGYTYENLIKKIIDLSLKSNKQ
jgi:D-alanine-D-alanine ligase